MKFSPKNRFLPERRDAGRFLVRLVSALLAMTILTVSLLSAQEGEPRQGVTFWLLDDDGNWKVPLPNWSVDDVTALLDQNQRQRESASFTIMSLEMNGSVSASRATLMIEYEINVSPSPGQSGPIRVPLGMKEGAYRPEGDKGEPNFNADGPGEVVLDVDPETGGYAVLIYPSASPRSGGTPDRETPPPAEESAADEPAEAEGETAGEGDGGSPGEPAEIEETAPDEPSAAAIQIYTVRLALIFPVTQTAGSDESLLLLTPPPAVSSRARILVPLPDVEISTSEGVIASSPVHVSENASELSVFGFNRSGTATAIRWRPAVKNEAALPVTYRVENAVIDLNPTGDGIEYDVSLPIRVFGGSQDVPNRLLRVELPKGARPDMQNVHVSAGGGDISEATYREIPASDVRPSPALEVSIPGNIDSLVLRLAAFVPSVEENKWECTGFHLEGAQKETGEIIVRLPDDEKILPGLVPGNGVRDIGQPDTAEGGDKSARFRFYKEPFSLKSDPIPRQTRLIAQPEYQVLISGQDVRMKARVAYSAYGAPLREVRVKNTGWLFTDFDDGSGIDQAETRTDPETGETIISLKKQIEGDFTLSWESVRDLNRQRGTVEFEIPELSADWVASPTLTIVPDDNIELVPFPGLLKGLTPKKPSSSRPAIELPQREQAPLVYQVQREGIPEGESPLFAARFILHTGEVSVNSSLSVRLDRAPAELVQVLEYHIKYVPVQSLDFTVPQEMTPLTNPEIFLNGKPVAADILAAEKGAGGIDVTRRTVRLPAPGLIGDVRLEFRAGIELPAISPDQSNILNIPLAVPVAAHAESSSAEAAAPPEFTLHIPDEEHGWKETNSSQKGGIRYFAFTSPSLPQWLPLRAVVDQNARTTGGLTAEYIWAQTFLGRDSYFERISCRISGNQPVFALQLPPGAHSGQMAVSVDGVSIPLDYLPDERILRIPLPETAKTETALVSIWYLIPRGEHELEFPDLLGQTMIRRCYMQLILPANTLLRQVPEGWSSEESEFGRHPKTSRLAAAIGTPLTEGDEPPKSSNVYLLSSFNPPTRVHIHLISRTAIVLIGSGLILLFGICYIYLPRLRYIEGIILSVTLSLSIFLFRPQVVLFYLQFTVIGIVLILGVLLLRQWMKRRRVPAPGPAVGVPRPASAPAQEKSHPGSTASRPAAMPKPAAEPASAAKPSADAAEPASAAKPSADAAEPAPAAKPSADAAESASAAKPDSDSAQPAGDPETEES